MYGLPDSCEEEDVVCIDMKLCYPASFQGEGEAKPYCERFGHPTHRMIRVAINGELPADISTGFAEIQEWEFEEQIHPVIQVWYGGHFADKGWALTALLSFWTEARILESLKVGEAIISLDKQTGVWLPEDRDQGCAIIGKFTQGSKAGGKRLTRRLVTDPGELAFLERDTRINGTLVGAPQRCPLRHILTYYDSTQLQYPHLRASMLGYAHINMITMLKTFEPDEVVRVAIDTLYIRKSALHRLQGVEAYVSAPPEEEMWENLMPTRPVPRPAQWRDKGENLYAPDERAEYYPKPEHIKQAKALPNSTAPRYEDPMTRHRRTYLNGGGGSGKTTRAIELFRVRDPLVLTPTHRLAKEMRARGVKVQTYHSFFRLSGKND